MEKFFKLKENGTNVSTEVLAGLTTFFTMAYILFVNPDMLQAAGIPYYAVFLATILASAIGTLVMGLFANVPYALAPGMGLNSFFTYYVVLQLGFTWQEGLAMVFVCGIVNILITITRLRKAIISAIPESLQHAIGGGIGIFIAYLGFLNAGIIDISGAVPGLATLNNTTAILTLIGFAATIILLLMKVKGAILIGIIGTTLLGIPMNVVDISSVSITTEAFSTMFTDFSSVFGQAFTGLSTLFADPSRYLQIFMTIFAFSLTDTFDTIGTFIGTGRKSGIFSDEDIKSLQDSKGFSSRMDRALFADAIGTSVGAVLGTSNTTTYVESAAGIEAGGKTGLTATTVAICFLLSIFFAPIALLVPSAATSPALIVVGIMMMSSFAEIKWGDLEEAIPCFFAGAFMGLSYSIATGIAFGFITYIVVKLALGKIKQVHPIVIVTSLLFLVNYVYEAWTSWPK